MTESTGFKVLTEEEAAAVTRRHGGGTQRKSATTELLEAARSNPVFVPFGKRTADSVRVGLHSAALRRGLRLTVKSTTDGTGFIVRAVTP